MRLLCLIVVGLLVPLYELIAQLPQPDEMISDGRRAKAIYVEMLGSSGLNYSLNYDMRFKPGHRGWGFRAGVTWPVQVGQTKIYSLPLLLNKVLSEKRFSFEVGGGFLVVYRRRTFEDANNQIQHIQSVTVPAVANLGVRFQPLKTGIVWRLYWNPTWRIDNSLKPELFWFGTSLGIGFN